MLTRGVEAGAVVPLGAESDRPVVEVGGRADAEDGRFTTRGLLLTETHAIHAAITRRDTDAGIASPAAVSQAIRRRPSLSGEQADMIRQLCTGGDGVAVVVGRAGTGKTYALDAAREAWEASGIRVSGVALAARAALELQESAGIPAGTLSRLLHQFDDHSRPGGPLQPGQVLVVDEAGMIGTRQLARLLEHTRALQVKTILVGDPHQLPEIDAGGLFVALSRRLPTVELADNRRQHTGWERAVLNQLRHGDVPAAVAEYDRRGRIVTGDTAEAIREQLVSDWWDTMRHQPHHGSAVMVALRRSDVDDLNRRARARMTAAGQLTGPAIHAAGTDGLQVGDRIVCLRNSRQLDVVNGTRATITATTGDGGVTVCDDHGRQRTLTPEYLAAGHVTYGYAITGHKAQGLTVDHTFVLGSDALYRQWGYVAMSRGRDTNRLYRHAVPDLAPDAHQRPRPVDPVADITRQLQRDTTAIPLSDQTARAITHAQQRLDQARQWLSQPQVHTAIDLQDRHDHDIQRHERLGAEHDRLSARYHQLGVGLSRGARIERRDLQQRLEQLTNELNSLRDHILDTRTTLAGLPAPELIQRVRDQERQAQRQLEQLTRPRLTEPEAPARQHGITRGRSR